MHCSHKKILAAKDHQAQQAAYDFKMAQNRVSNGCIKINDNTKISIDKLISGIRVIE